MRCELLPIKFSVKKKESVIFCLNIREISFVYCSCLIKFQTARNNSLPNPVFHLAYLVHTDIILYIRTSTNICLLWYSRQRNIHNTLNNSEPQSSVCFMSRGLHILTANGTARSFHEPRIFNWLCRRSVNFSRCFMYVTSKTYAHNHRLNTFWMN